jgi:hypothetical protein
MELNPVVFDLVPTDPNGFPHADPGDTHRYVKRYFAA